MIEVKSLTKIIFYDGLSVFHGLSGQILASCKKVRGKYSDIDMRQHDSTVI